MSKSHDLMPGKQKVYIYWKKHWRKLGRTRMDTTGFEADYMVCFACGDKRSGLQRCHIHPLCFGGSNDLSNIHILCRRCHLESEGLLRYWQWIKHKRKYEWDFFENHVIDLMLKCGIDFWKEVKELGEKYDNDSSKCQVVLDEIHEKVFWKYASETAR